MNNIEKQWRVFLKNIIENGIKHEKDDGDIIYESMINHCFIPNVLNQYGNQTITTELFLNMIKQGKFNMEGCPVKDLALYEYVTSLDNPEIINNKDFKKDEDSENKSDKFTYTYPNRIFHMNDRETDFFVNQFNLMIDRLTNPKKQNDKVKYWNGSNRAVANIYSAPLDCDMNDIPCLNWMQVTIRNNELILHVMFRSNDCFGAFPSNMLFLTYLGLKFTDKLKEKYPLLTFKGINYNSTSLHIYNGDYEQAKKVIRG